MSGGRKRALLALAALAATVGVAFTTANFIASSTNAAYSVGAAPDYSSPTVPSSTISRTSSGTPTGTPGSLKQGGTYRVYADVSETGNPASGVASVAADLSNVSGGGASSVALTTCSS